MPSYEAYDQKQQNKAYIYKAMTTYDTPNLGLENRRRWKSTVGSNPTSSATKPNKQWVIAKAL